MEIHIRRNGKPMGPYSLEEAREALTRNELTLADEAWHPGLHGWTPLESIVQPLEGDRRASAQTTVNKLVAGLTSFARTKRRMGCCGWITLAGVAFIVFIVIFGLIQDAVEPDLSIQGTTGTITMSAPSTYTAKLIGKEIAKRVYDVATKHAELTVIVVKLDFNPALLVDRYGHNVKGPLHMGSVTVNDLAEVRRYEFDGAYMSESEYGFAEEVSRMEYAENLEK